MGRSAHLSSPKPSLALKQLSRAVLTTAKTNIFRLRASICPGSRAENI